MAVSLAPASRPRGKEYSPRLLLDEVSCTVSDLLVGVAVNVEALLPLEAVEAYGRQSAH